MRMDQPIHPPFFAENTPQKNPLLRDKNIYVIATGAHKVRELYSLLEILQGFGASIYLLASKEALRLLTTQKLLNQLEDLDIEIITDYGHPFELPPEDIVLVAPCTFNSLQKIAHGISDNYVLSITSTAISKGNPVVLAPAFNELWSHPLTMQAIETLTSWGVRVVWPEILDDKVTMMDTNKIADTVYSVLNKVKFDWLQIESPEAIALYSESIEAHYADFLETGKQQATLNLNSAAHGCYSVRINDEWILITATGCHLDELQEDDLVLVHIGSQDTIYYHGKKVPSSETPLHIQMYLQDDSYRAVIHSHSPKITYAQHMQKYATTKYVVYGVFDGSYEACSQCHKQGGFAILKYHGELTADTTLSKALNKLRNHGNNEKIHA